MTAGGPRRPGTVVWVDLSTPDVERSIDFYETLFGWSHEQLQTPLGSYVVARVPSGDVGGMMAQPPGDQTAGVPPCWTVFFGTEDLEATLAAVVGLGGTVLQPAMPVPGGARVAAVADPAGAVLALMQSPPSERGIVWGEPSSVSWAECISRDVPVSRRFYEELFGWKAEDGAGGYVVFHLDGERVGGLLTTPGTVPSDVPSYWLLYFEVPDVAATCTRVAELGGEVLEPVHEIDEGRFAILEDPAGAVFAVYQGRAS